MTALAQQLIAGTARHLGHVTSVMLLGTSYTPAELMAELRRTGTLHADLDAANAKTAATLEARDAGMATIRPLMQAIVAYAKVTYGNQPDILGDFGVHPKAPRTLTVEEKTAAATKRLATREARGTKGSVQKKAIKGDVAGIVVSSIKTKPVGIS
ncbi:MAG: hypothetical protein ACRENE_02925 [Polyangiaceae bacterium]